MPGLCRWLSLSHTTPHPWIADRSRGCWAPHQAHPNFPTQIHIQPPPPKHPWPGAGSSSPDSPKAHSQRWPVSSMRCPWVLRCHGPSGEPQGGAETWRELGREGHGAGEVLQNEGLVQASRTGWLSADIAMSVIIFLLSPGDLPRALDIFTLKLGVTRFSGDVHLLLWAQAKGSACTAKISPPCCTVG